MNTTIPNDLREMYASTAIWDGSLMVRFAQEHGIIPWTISADSDLRRYLIERIAELEAHLQQLQATLEKFGTHRMSCMLYGLRQLQEGSKATSNCTCGLSAALAATEPKETK